MPVIYFPPRANPTPAKPLPIAKPAGPKSAAALAMEAVIDQHELARAASVNAAREAAGVFREELARVAKLAKQTPLERINLALGRKGGRR